MLILDLWYAYEMQDLHLDQLKGITVGWVPTNLSLSRLVSSFKLAFESRSTEIGNWPFISGPTCEDLLSGAILPVVLQFRRQLEQRERVTQIGIQEISGSAPLEAA